MERVEDPNTIEINPCSNSYAERDDIFENEIEPVAQIQKPLNMKPGAVKLREWLNKNLRIQMSDGRILIGIFLCTDRDANVILGSCAEYLPGEKTDEANLCDEPRMLGLVMVPGKHIQNVSIDKNEFNKIDTLLMQPLTNDVTEEDVM